MEKMKREYLEVSLPQEGQRLDRLLTDALPDLSRSRIQNLIKNENVAVDGSPAKASYKVRAGERLEITIPSLQTPEIEGQNLNIEIVYEDADIAVVNKPRGMVVHPAPGNRDQTLVNGLLAQLKDLSGINGDVRPGIVHRIDKDTSGLLLVAKNDFAHLALAEQIKAHTVIRVYEAIVDGVVAEPGGLIDCPIGRHPVERKKMAVTEKNSRTARTNYRVLERFHDYTHLEARLETGRTHQIRVHMRYIGYPLLGDPLYGKGEKNPFHLTGQALHARTIGFVHPRTGAAMEFSAPLPEEIEKILEKLRKSH